MHLSDAFIQSDLHCIQVTVFYIWSALAFPGNRTHDLGVASAMLYHLSYRKATFLIDLDYRLVFSWKQQFDVKMSSWWICFLQTCSFSLHNTLLDGLLLVYYCDVIIRCLDSNSDGTHSLQSIHWWASDVMLHFSKSDEETNSSTSWMTWGWEKFQQIKIFGWTVLLNSKLV